MADEPASSGPAQAAEAAEHPARQVALIGWAEITNSGWKPSFTREQAGPGPGLHREMPKLHA